VSSAFAELQQHATETAKALKSAYDRNNAQSVAQGYVMLSKRLVPLVKAVSMVLKNCIQENLRVYMNNEIQFII
ncbi:hypothetical protein ACJEM4_24860, partial [Escherichia coli]